MKQVKLMNLTLKNFKGIKKFELGADGQDIRVLGDNATGKTSLFDSFVWLLFNKDSNNRADFAIKTLDKGKEINNLEHEVEAVFKIDGQQLILRKVYKEKWTKKRNAPIAEFTGHETDHYIDGVPVKKKEYADKVDSIVKEEVFKLLTSPTFFNEQMKWQDRRATLLEVCGDVEEEDVLAFNSKLKDLPTILQGRTIENHRKVIASRRTEINKELERIPVRIDEINNSLPEIVGDVEALKTDVEGIEKQLDEKATLINNIRNGAVIIDRQQKLKQTEMDLDNIKRDLESESTQEGFKIQTKIQEEQSNLANLKRKKEDAEHQIKRNKEEFETIETKLIPLREEYGVLEKTEFAHEVDCVCPTCEQDLPAEQVEAAKEKAVAAFQLKKSQRLEEIQELGRAGAKKKEEILELNKKLSVKVEAVQSEIELKEKSISKLESELETLRASIKDARQDEKYQAKLLEQEALKAEIQKLQNDAQSAISEVEDEVYHLKMHRSEVNAIITQYAQVEASNKRIAELEEQQKELATEFEKLEGELFLTEEFIRSKVELLTEKINSKFKFARFKLFDTQINGGITEVCETLYEGVPYSSGLNNAARINVGIDIINTLTEHFGIKAPIFVDNAEAVTQIAETDSQLISLVVSEKDKELRIETQSETESDVA